VQTSPLLSLMEHAARKAGESLYHDFKHRDSLLIEVKKPGDFVSQADRKAENIIVEILQEAYPKWGVLGEEGTDITAGETGCRWIIDPLDGTTNFLHGVPNWCVTIALEKDNDIVAALTLDVMRDELFTAESGKGAYLNGTRLRVSSEHDLEKCIAAIDGALYLEDDMAYLAGIWQKTYATCASTTVLCSAALTLAYTAAGRFAVSYVAGVQPWDVAAGLLLIREAGGIVTDLELKQAHHSKGQTIAANRTLHAKYCEVIGLK
jgi:myo-inositol-1(or 4)-monophosphatase